MRVQLSSKCRRHFFYVRGWMLRLRNKMGVSASVRLLLIEDNRDIAGVIFDYFEVIGGYELDYASDGQQGLQLALEQDFEVIILDLMLPRVDGLQVCAKLRERGNNSPILMLTARGDREDILVGFEAGADDYLVKPFDLAILEARVQALARRGGGVATAANSDLRFDELRLERGTRTLHRAGLKFVLNQTQFVLLRELMSAAPEACRRENLIRAVWGDEPPEGDLLRSHIYQLRTLIDKPFDWHYIATVPKLGYRLQAPES